MQDEFRQYLKISFKQPLFSWQTYLVPPLLRNFLSFIVVYLLEGARKKCQVRGDIYVERHVRRRSSVPNERRSVSVCKLIQGRREEERPRDLVNKERKRRDRVAGRFLVGIIEIELDNGGQRWPVVVRDDDEIQFSHAPRGERENQLTDTSTRPSQLNSMAGKRYRRRWTRTLLLLTGWPEENPRDAFRFPPRRGSRVRFYSFHSSTSWKIVGWRLELNSPRRSLFISPATFGLEIHRTKRDDI